MAVRFLDSRLVRAASGWELLPRMLGLAFSLAPTSWRSVDTDIAAPGSDSSPVFLRGVASICLLVVSFFLVQEHQGTSLGVVRTTTAPAPSSTKKGSPSRGVCMTRSRFCVVDRGL